MAIIIGASTGMGAALAPKLVEKGFQVALVARQVDKLDALAEYLNTSYREKTVAPVARTYQHDVRNFDTVAGLLDHIRRDAGKDGGEIGVVVYAAGIMPPGERGQWTLQEEQRTIETNLIGAMLWIGASAEVMTHIGHGTIVGISSVAGDRGRRGNSSYMASKAALTVYLESLRHRLHGTGVRIVTVKPGYVATPMNAGVKLPKMLTISADEAADRIARLCIGGKMVAYIPGYWRLIMLIIRALPASVLVRLPI